MQKTEISAKTVIVGDAGVGKTCIAKRKFLGIFDEASIATMGSEYVEGIEEVGHTKVRFEVWDTAGQEQYRSMVPMYLRDASVAIFVYDIAKSATVDVLPAYKKQVAETAPGAIIAIVGNKLDMNRDVEREIGENLKDQLGAAVFVETSAKTGEGLDDLFGQLARELCLSREESCRTETLELTNSNDNRKKCNC